MSRQINKAYKFRIYPDKKQTKKIEDHFKANRFCYNHILGEQKEISDLLDMYGLKGKEKIKYMKSNDLYFSRSKSTRYLTQLAKTNKLLSSVASGLRTYSMISLEQAYKNISLNFGFPKFKTKFDRIQSYTVQVQHHNFFKHDGHSKNYLQQVKGKNYRLMIPIVGRVKIKMHNKNFCDFENKIQVCFYTISKLNENYYVSINARETIDDPVFIDGDVLGIDVGIKRTITTSESSDFSRDVYIKTIYGDKTKEQEEFKRLWKISKRKEVGSSSYNRSVSKIMKLRNKGIQKRQNLRHKITNEILSTGKFTCFAVEDLSIEKMKKNGMTNHPFLNKKINHQWHVIGIKEIMRQLEYKCLWNGYNFIKVPPYNTSITCNKCGHIDKRNRHSQGVFYCSSCGHEDNADINAAKNIADIAKKLYI